MNQTKKYEYIVNLTSYSVQEDHITFDCRTSAEREVAVRLDVWASDIIRIRLFPTGKVEERRSYIPVKQIWPHARFEIEERADNIFVTTRHLKVRVQKVPWEVAFFDGSEKLVCKENVADLDVTGRLKIEPLGFLVKGESEVTSVREVMFLAPDEHLYGFGEKFTSLDKRGQKMTSWNIDAYGNTTERSYKNIPFFMSSKGYGIFINSPCKIVYDIGTESCISYSFTVMDSMLDFCFIYGPLFKQIIERYTEITGKAPVPPEWSFGLWMSSSYYETSYKNRKELESFCEKLRNEDIPCDVIHLDPLWMKLGNYCDFIWDLKAFPNPREMISNLAEKGFKLCLWEHPYVSVRSEMYKEGRERGYFITKPDGSVYVIDVWAGQFPPVAIVDFTNPNAKKWYQEKHKDLIEMGVRTFKTDFGENVPEDACFHDGSQGLQIHNVYPVLYQGAVIEAIERFSKRRGLIWGRSAYAGSQRHPTHWSGDPASNFPTMACVLRGGLSYGLSGVPFWSHDIGGFGVINFPKPTPEIYIRWTQFGLFSSHSRCHGATRRDPWEFGDEAVRIFRIYAKLRYRLIPYIYSYAHIASKTGLPIMRAMVLEYQEDPNTFDLDLQYLFGRELLVAPVFNENRRRSIYLPKGKWIDYWNKKEYEGSCYVEYEAQLDILPIFVKEDSIIPMGPEMSYVNQRPLDPMTLDIYIYKKAEFTVYDDDEITSFKATKTDGEISLVIGKSTRSYIIIFNNMQRPRRVEINGIRLEHCKTQARFNKARTGWLYRRPRQVIVKVVTGGETATLRIKGL